MMQFYHDVSSDYGCSYDEILAIHFVPYTKFCSRNEFGAPGQALRRIVPFILSIEKRLNFNIATAETFYLRYVNRDIHNNHIHLIL